MRMKTAVSAFSTDEKKKLLDEWKRSNLSLPQWRQENAEKYNLPHLSTLYDWCKRLGYSTEPGVTEEPEESPETPDETEDSTDSNKSDEPTETGQSGGEKEPAREEGEEVIAKERITNLEPSTVPDPPKSEAPKETPKGKGISKSTFIIIGGALILGVGGFLIFKKLKRKSKAQESATKQQSKGGNPFDGGYTTIDQF